MAPPYILQRDPAQKFMGLGFRMQTPTKKWADTNWPPVPANQPNPVGIDGVLQGLCPPYVSSMNDAVDQLLAEKYGKDGLYTDLDVFKIPYQNQADAENLSLIHISALPHRDWREQASLCACSSVAGSFNRRCV